MRNCQLNLSACEELNEVNGLATILCGRGYLGRYIGGIECKAEDMKDEVLDALVAAGCTAEQIAAAVKADGRSRSKAAMRQARYRERKSQQSVTRDVTSRNVDNKSPSPDKECSPTPPQEINPIHIPPSPPKGGSSPREIECKILEAYSEMAQKAGLAIPRSITGSRRKGILSRVQESGIEAVLEAIQAIGESSFCRGRNDRGWRADFDFLCQAKSFTALLEGKYADRKVERAPPKLGQWAQRQQDSLDVFDRFLGVKKDDEFAGNTIDIEPGAFRAH